MNPPGYEYKSLDPDSRELRLLRLFPGAWDDEISCELHIASLNDTPKYQTLSYVSGDPNITETILLHGYEFQVTTNLYAALRRLRLPTDTRVIWIDGLCIDQSSLDERSQQVSMMGEIHGGCQEVLMWLGETEGRRSKNDRQTLEEGHKQLRRFRKAGKFTRDPKYSHLDNYDVLLAFAMFYIFASNKHVNELPCFKHNGSQWEISDSFAAGFREFKNILDSAYWSRIWIVQEITLPLSATVVYGSMNCPWCILVDAGAALQSHASSCCMEKCNGFSDELQVVLSRFSLNVRLLDEIRTRRSNGTELDLFSLLRQNFHREATDSRDKVYGVLGLVSSPRDVSSVKPDYRKSTREVYEEVTMHLFKATASLFVWTADATRNAKFPSWVVDWGQSPKQNLWHLDIQRTAMYHYYNATKDRELVAKRLQESLLEVEGMLIDTIATVGPLMGSDPGGDSVPTTCRGILVLAHFPDDDEQSYRCGGTWADAFWQTLCGGTIMDTEVRQTYEMRRTNLEDRWKYELWKYYKDRAYDPAVDTEPGRTGFKGYQMTVVRATRNRKFFVTRTGYLGLGPCGTSPGDEVYLISGSKVPFVLRKVEDLETVSPENDSSSYPVYRVIGDCYVHGIMDGEALEGVTASAGSLLLH